MRTIWKFTLEVTDQQTLLMPAGAQILSVQVQHGAPQLWAAVDSDSPLESRSFEIFGTGHWLPPRLGAFVGAFQISGGTLVFHVFEATPNGQL